METLNITKTENGITTFTNEFCKVPPFDLAVKCISLGLIYGIDKVEKIIENTYVKEESTKIKQTINYILSNSI